MAITFRCACGKSRTLDALPPVMTLRCPVCRASLVVAQSAPPKPLSLYDLAPDEPIPSTAELPIIEDDFQILDSSDDLDLPPGPKR